jgi:hypothetical protein
MPAKKTTKKVITKKSVARPAPVAEHKCMCSENCHCHCRAHLIKHIITWAIIFALGMVCGKMIGCCGHHGMKHMPKMNPVFENGCLKMDSIPCPKMQEKLMNADVSGDGCVSVEEYKAVKKEMMKDMKKDMRGHKWGRHHDDMRGPRDEMEPQEPVME